MTDPWGIDDSYEDAFGGRHHLTPEARRRLEEAMRIPAGATAPPQHGPMRFVREDDRALSAPATIVLEDGRELRAEDAIPADLPFGYHRLAEDGAEPVDLVSSPRACPLPDPAWGLAVQLYAARSRSSWGMGDLADLRRLSAWSADRLGASVLLVNPLGASLPLDTQQPSPYFASSRRFPNPLYLRIEEVPGAEHVELDALARAGRALCERPTIDRDEVWRLKRQALETIFEAGPLPDAFHSWRRAQGEPLEHYARFCVLCERHQSGWRRWPAEHRRPDAPGVAAFAAERASRVTFHAWLQWLLEQQLARATSGIGLVQDLPIGFDSEGADGWAWQDCLALDVEVGAPPDPFNASGQAWGLPPFIPWKLRELGYQPFIDTLRAAFAHEGGLRVDHVMGLFRLFWIPRGLEAAEGTYVHYPAEDLLDLLALESHRAGAFVVGEDLGTVPPGVREALHARNILSYRLLWFEDAPPEEWPERSMAAVGTHDLPTVPGLWSGADLTDQRRWGLPVGDDALDELRDRLVRHGHLSPEDTEADAVRGAYAALSRAPSRITLASIEDPLLIRTRPNLPGVMERPNWCEALPMPLEELEDDARVAEIAATLANRRS